MRARLLPDPLYDAVKEGRLDEVQRLTNVKPDMLKNVYENGYTLPDIAFAFARPEMIQLLIGPKIPGILSAARVYDTVVDILERIPIANLALLDDEDPTKPEIAQRIRNCVELVVKMGIGSNAGCYFCPETPGDFSKGKWVKTKETLLALATFREKGPNFPFIDKALELGLEDPNVMHEGLPLILAASRNGKHDVALRLLVDANLRCADGVRQEVKQNFRAAVIKGTIDASPLILANPKIRTELLEQDGAGRNIMHLLLSTEVVEERNFEGRKKFFDLLISCARGKPALSATDVERLLSQQDYQGRIPFDLMSSQKIARSGVSAEDAAFAKHCEATLFKESEHEIGVAVVPISADSLREQPRRR